MEKISRQQYQQLIEGAEVIEKDGFGVKVLDTHKGEMIKLFRRKRVFSTALFKPYAVRFVNNAKQLTLLGIPTITINRLLWCGSIKRHIVIYERLEGELLRDSLSQLTEAGEEPFKQFGEFVATLHAKGVYFRSAHLKNILVLPNGDLGLIDISDMQIKRGVLGVNLRKRNFEHILRYQKDKDLIRKHFDSFISGYRSVSKISEENSLQIKQTIRSILASTQGA
ncbi:MAG: toluene tolerance protein [Cycloclasticus sp. symbiont of Bathymodiolus heckerae]|nr:MAG: toluene tolerance protein [Cycloclasticus sp. symbiont of Bathymodiolus heckerae]